MSYISDQKDALKENFSNDQKVDQGKNHPDDIKINHVKKEEGFQKDIKEDDQVHV